MIRRPPRSTLFPYTDALPISVTRSTSPSSRGGTAPPSTCSSTPSASRSPRLGSAGGGHEASSPSRRSEEHTSELQSRQYIVCRLLLEKKKFTYRIIIK